MAVGPWDALFQLNRIHAEPQSQVIERGSAKGDLAGKREARNPGELEPQHAAEGKRSGVRGGLQGGCVHLSVLGALPHLGEHKCPLRGRVSTGNKWEQGTIPS